MIGHLLSAMQSCLAYAARHIWKAETSRSASFSPKESGWQTLANIHKLIDERENFQNINRSKDLLQLRLDGELNMWPNEMEMYTKEREVHLVKDVTRGPTSDRRRRWGSGSGMEWGGLSAAKSVSTLQDQASPERNY